MHFWPYTMLAIKPPFTSEKKHSCPIWRRWKFQLYKGVRTWPSNGCVVSLNSCSSCRIFGGTRLRAKILWPPEGPKEATWRRGSEKLPGKHRSTNQPINLPCDSCRIPFRAFPKSQTFERHLSGWEISKSTVHCHGKTTRPDSDSSGDIWSLPALSRGRAWNQHTAFGAEQQSTAYPRNLACTAHVKKYR